MNGSAEPEPRQSGLPLMIGAAFWFSVMSVLVKLAGARLPSMEIVLSRAVITLVISYSLLRRAKVSVWGRRRGLLVARGLCGFIALACYYLAIVSLPLAEATTIHHTSPVFTAVLAWLLLRERVGAAVWIALCFGLAGVVIVARPQFLFGDATVEAEDVAVLAALAGAIFTALAYVTVRRLTNTEHPLVIIFYFPLVAVPLSIPLAIGDWLWPTVGEWLTLIGVGVATQIAQVLLTTALQRERAGRATAVGYLQVVFAIIWGLALFGETPSSLTIAGAAFVLVSTAVVAAGRR